MSTHLEKGSAVGFARQLFSGSEDSKQLEAIMLRLGREKTDLAISLSLVNVGLAVVVNTEAVWRMHSLLKGLLGQDGGLKLAQVIKSRLSDVDDNGTLALGGDDLQAIAEISASRDAGVPGQKVRIIQDNTALMNALQVNTPVGQDIWKDVDIPRIERNLADRNAAQFNYPIDSNTFLAALQLKYKVAGN
ncbi:hypothetical protein C8A03DRAFT_36034 [Achaetomium macrosporum]|uniref:Uncharacterized protein n=1 Tax=Achaetomium macrosporum TaxID=79813 RepID=A0AAN7H984_9PEZI|nr:hypothetical protein C8A03DRAFT_36034 [Achaetomium macrosporum]